jgi:hypothetical protein
MDMTACDDANARKVHDVHITTNAICPGYGMGGRPRPRQCVAKISSANSGNAHSSWRSCGLEVEYLAAGEHGVTYTGWYHLDGVIVGHHAVPGSWVG